MDSRLSRVGLILFSSSLAVGGCGGGADVDVLEAVADAGEAAFVGDSHGDDSGDAAPDPCGGLGPECLPVVERGNIKVVYLHGTPYEMGFQHGTLLHEELREGVAEINGNIMLAAMKEMALGLGLFDLAQEMSLPEIIEECQGMEDAAGDVGWTMQECMVLNFGDALAEFIQHGMHEDGVDIVPGCTQVVVSGPATKDGRVYHLRLLDWSSIEFIVNNPVVFVRSPAGGIPHVFIGFPGNLSTYQGMNLDGVVAASNEVSPIDPASHDSVGVSHVQLQSRLLATVHDVDEAAKLLHDANHMTMETIVASDPDGGAVFELAPAAVGTRSQEAGVVFATNHFVAAETEKLDKVPPSNSSLRRFERVAELVTPGGKDTLYGTLDPAALVAIARDRVNPWTGEESPFGTIEDDSSIATNGALYAVVFDPGSRLFWVAAGGQPVPPKAFTGFSLRELLNLPGSEGTTPADFPEAE